MTTKLLPSRGLTLLLISAMLLMLGCGPQYMVVKPDKPEMDLQKDALECAALANQAASGAGAWSSDRALRAAFYDIAREQYLASCLQTRGWGITQN